MKKSRAEDLPTIAFIEHQIIAKAAADGMLQAASDKVWQTYDCQPGTMPGAPFFQSRVLSLLYCLLVFPREFWSRRGLEIEIGSEIEKYELTIQFMNEKNQWAVRRVAFDDIRRLRNSIAHARIWFDDDHVHFQDGRKSDYRTKMNPEEILLFLTKVGIIFCNARHRTLTLQ